VWAADNFGEEEEAEYKTSGVRNSGREVKLHCSTKMWIFWGAKGLILSGYY